MPAAGVIPVPEVRAVPPEHGVPIAADDTIDTPVYSVPSNEKVGVTGPPPSALKAAVEAPQLNRTVPGPTGADGVPIVKVEQVVVRWAPVVPEGNVWVNNVTAATTIAIARQIAKATANFVFRRIGLRISSIDHSAIARA